ncbi:MAG: M23 family metallopeptidase [Candidatus Goldbacteria bacterium]|nr:M23 family metallopeptidase [Candidatus Goldiibacteriota bacterium]
MKRIAFAAVIIIAVTGKCLAEVKIMLSSNIVKEGGVVKAVLYSDMPFSGSEAEFRGEKYPVFFRSYDKASKEFTFLVLVPVPLETIGVKKLYIRYMMNGRKYERMEKIEIKKISAGRSDVQTYGKRETLGVNFGPENKIIKKRQEKRTPLKFDLPFIKPAEGEITSAFGKKRTYDGGKYSSTHKGVDIANKAGTKVAAANHGKVVEAATMKGHGVTVIIDHGGGLYSLYFHLKGVYVKKGMDVKKGDIIATMGSTGVSTGPHLHWQINLFGVPVSPMDFTTMM